MRLVESGLSKSYVRPVVLQGLTLTNHEVLCSFTMRTHVRGGGLFHEVGVIDTIRGQKKLLMSYFDDNVATLLWYPSWWIWKEWTTFPPTPPPS